MTDNNMNGPNDSKADKFSVPKERGTLNDVAEFAKMLRPFDVDLKLIHPFKQMKKRPKFRRY